MKYAAQLAILLSSWLCPTQAFVGNGATQNVVRLPSVKKSDSPRPYGSVQLHAASTMGAKTQCLLINNRFVVESIEAVAPDMSEIHRLRFALQFTESTTSAKKAAKEAVAWRNGKGRAICESAAAAVAQATAGGGWENEVVRNAAPKAGVINKYITPDNVLTMSTDEGDLVYVIRASLINDKELMDNVSVDELCDFFLYAKEVHNIVANERSARTGRFCNVIFANDIVGVRKPPDKRFSQALTASSSQYEALYPALAGPTMILNLPFILQAFVGLLKPLFPKSVQGRLVFKKAPVLASVKVLGPLIKDKNVNAKFIREVKSLLPEVPRGPRDC